MKKRIVFIAACLILLTFSLIGCESIKYDTAYNSQTVWNETENKESVDVITIKNIDIAKLITIPQLKITVKRKFEGDKITIDFSLDELTVNFSSNAQTLLGIVLGIKDLNLNMTFEQIKGIVDNINEIKGQIILTNDKTKIDYNINVDINYDVPNYNSSTTGSVTIAPDIEYSDAISRSMDLLTSHFTTLIQPTKEGKAELMSTNISKIIKSAVDYYEANDPDIGTAGYVRLSQKIKNILGVSYTEFLTDKIKVTNSKSKCKIKDNFIKSMNISLLNVQLLYNKEQLTEVAKKAVELLSPEHANYINLLKPYLDNINKDSCIVIGEINLNSTYTLK